MTWVSDLYVCVEGRAVAKNYEERLKGVLLDLFQ